METGDVLGGRGQEASGRATVRRARAGDIASIAAVQARALLAAYTGLLDPQAVAGLTPAALEPSWHAAVGRPPSARHAVLVACSGTAVVGVAAVRPSPDADATRDDGELAVLAVDPAHQRAGHGSRLLAAAADILREAGVRTLSTWAPATDDARRAFLASAGLVVDGARRTYATSDGRRVVEVRLGAALGA